MLAAAKWLLGQPLDHDTTEEAMEWFFTKRQRAAADWVAVACAQIRVMAECEPVGPDEMMGAYGDLGRDEYLMGDEEPKNAGAQKIQAWRTRNEQAFWRLLDDHPLFAQSLAHYVYHVSTTLVPIQCFRRRSDGDDLRIWMERIQRHLRNGSDQSSKRKFQAEEFSEGRDPPGKRIKRSPA